MTSERFILGFSEEEKKNISSSLEKLLPHLEKERFVIVGGLAIRYHLINAGKQYPQREFNDLDIIVQETSVVRPSITQDFLISHHHPDDGYFALVDPITRIKLDIFNYYPRPRKLVQIDTPFGKVNVVSPEDQLVKTVFDALRISEEAHVDPKQFQDMEFLLQISDRELADEIWKSHNFENKLEDIFTAIKEAQQKAKEHPEWLEEHPFRRPEPYECQNCESTAEFPITDMRIIYEVLGY